MELIFIRHGETEFNKHHQVMGTRIDAPLDAEGIEQAKDAISKLPEKVGAIYASPLKRAVQTAQVISEHYNMPISYSDLLKERDFGSLSGKTWQEIDQETGKPMFDLDTALKYDYQPYGGESAAQVKARLQAFLDLLKQGKPHDTVIAVTHYGIICLMNDMFPDGEHHNVNNSSVHKYQI